MELSASPEQAELRAAVKTLLAERCDESVVRQLMESEDGRDTALWRQIVDMGLTGLAVPTGMGGSGCGITEVGIVAEEAGRALLPAPWFSTVALASTALLAVDDQEWLPQIADGSVTACLAQGSLELRGAALGGIAPYVIDGAHAELIVAIVDDSIAIISPDAPGITRRSLPTMDLTRKQAQLSFSGVPVTVVRDELAVQRTKDIAAILLAAEQVGGAQWALETARSYALQRKQFGKAIGTFQAVKHMLADVLVEVETARSAVAVGLWTCDNAPEDLPVVASLAQAWCSDTFTHATSVCIQVLGGIGFTWEHPAHLWFKRARADSVMFRSPNEAREQLLQRLGV